ncbi:hypothetical protein HN51_046115 [Arachis hypogaea]|uniref:Uncharacterized protein n=1 Tax=Arachis hypogaea TaxID=3818 RepID=A0A445ABQ0_ARAHY|nr:UPF0187 protein At3g61320, chloroplastic [Arachis ipaensis]XP_025631352.1 UPF0187 protein At3g61320, chloroplastic isoform X1 [Arachis hypogaea]QHO22154.1 UPF0187 protein [Arachis hypogaea]RYR23765.1 hypothetical protein Ahy_B02g057261 [Arachis hypogaea]
MNQYHTNPTTTTTKFYSQFTPKCNHLNHHNPKPLSFNLTISSSLKNQSQDPSKDPPFSQTLTSIFLSLPDWADAVKERGMQRKRGLYTHTEWLQHRSSLRHLRHLLSTLSSRVVLSLLPPVLAFTTFAAAIAAYNSAVSAHFLLPEYFPVLRASSLPYQLTAPALALLLVFRTEASYARFVEGKKAWTKVIAGAHDFATQVMAVVESPSDLPLKKALLQYIMAFPVVLKCHVLYGSDVRSDLQHVLEVDDLAIVINSKHRPRCIVDFISQSIHLLKLEDARRSALESKISCFQDGIGICEQLMGIPIPLSYTRLTSRFLVLWHLTLPVILWDDCHWMVVPATFISAASLFCIEEVGVLIEEPFPMLALDALCQKAHNDIQESIEAENLIHTQLVAKQKKAKKHSQSGHTKEHSPNGWPNS